MNARFKFLSVDDVVALHSIAIEDQGGDATVRDIELLESAVATPAQQFSGQYLHDDVPAIAAAYAFHVCKNHPFLDGNKRAATASMIAFLSDNGWRFDANVDEAERVIVQLAVGSMDKLTFTEWARQHMREKPKMELRDFFVQLKFQAIAEFLDSGMVHDSRVQAQGERFDTMMEAARAIPAIHEANLGAVQAEKSSNHEAATILRGQSLLLTAVYRIAQDMGYEW